MDQLMTDMALDQARCDVLSVLTLGRQEASRASRASQTSEYSAVYHAERMRLIDAALDAVSSEV